MTKAEFQKALTEYLTSEGDIMTALELTRDVLKEVNDGCYTETQICCDAITVAVHTIAVKLEVQ